MRGEGRGDAGGFWGMEGSLGLGLGGGWYVGV